MVPLLFCLSLLSHSPWVVTLEALDQFRVQGPEQDPPVLPYLQVDGKKNFDINLIQVMKHEELYWSKTGPFQLTECETGEKKVIFVDKNLLKVYRRKINEFITGIKSYCSHYGMNYFLCDTHIPFNNLLTDYLSKGALFR